MNGEFFRKQNTAVNQDKVNNVFKVFYGILFILLTEVCLGLYMYQYMNKEYNAIRRDYLLKNDFQEHLIESLKSDELLQLFERLDRLLQHRVKRAPTTIHPFYIRNPPPPGPPGRDGPPGPAGPPGPKGDPGLNGTPGVRGQKGEPGAGRPGEKGEKGDSGFPGPKGDPGDYGVPGIGLPGDRGDPGPPGKPGAKGDPGTDGLPGMGIDGMDGRPGPIGPPGPQGSTGTKGDKGDPGIQGIDGPEGPRGEKGQKGEPGLRGPEGAKGEQGTKGIDGAKGELGLPGPKGDTGPKGEDGETLIPGIHCWESNTTSKYTCSCPPGYDFNETSCVDIDECTQFKPCDPLSTCSNIEPGYECGPCPSGYMGNTSSIFYWLYLPTQIHKCIDIDECALNIDNCAADAACRNLPGKYECIRCDKNAHVFKTTANTEKCVCNVGWAGDGSVCGVDSDIDGWPDSDLGCTGEKCKKDNCPTTPNSGQEDADGDGIGDSCDNDSDNDGKPDNQDNCPLVANPDQSDKDSDGIGDACDNCPNQSNKGQQDLDNDKIGNECDPDIDGDGLDNSKDNCPKKANPDQLDSDTDGVGDVCDNCPFSYNPKQEDLDENLIGDACDVGADTDGDGIVDSLDNCKEIANNDQLDVDKDGIGDACDVDIDNDGHVNFYDNCPLVFNPDQKDVNGDGRGDACQNDMDGDGINDEYDNCPNNSLIYRTDFNYFQTVALDPVGSSQVDPNWVIYNKGAEIAQTENSDPGLAVGFNKIGGVDYEGTFFVEDPSDDDYAGFIFSYQSNRRFYVIAWKKGTQTYWEYSPFTAYGTPGIQIKLVNSATGPGQRLRNALWHAGTTTNEVKLLWQDSKMQGWIPKKSYRWKLIHRPKIGLIRLRMFDGPTLITDSGNIFDKTLRGGRLGVYCFSQEDIIWADVQYKCNDRVPKDIYDQLPHESQKLVEKEP